MNNALKSNQLNFGWDIRLELLHLPQSEMMDFPKEVDRW